MLTEVAVRNKQKRCQLIKRAALLNVLYGIIGMAILGSRWHQTTCDVPVREVTVTIIVVDLFLWPWMVGKMALLGYPRWTRSCSVVCSTLLYIVATLAARGLIQQMIIMHSANSTNGEECQVLSLTEQCNPCTDTQFVLPLCDRCQHCFNCATPIADVWYLLNMAYIAVEVTAIGGFLLIMCCVCCCVPMCVKCKKRARSTVGIRQEDDQTELFGSVDTLHDQHAPRPSSTQVEDEKFVKKLHATLGKDPDADISGFENVAER